MPIVPTENNADVDPKDGLPRKDASGMREAELHLQLQLHGDRDQKRTVLGSLVDHLYDGDSKSKANLEALSEQMKAARLSGDDTRYRETAAKVATALKEDREAMWTADTVVGVGTGAIKAAGLFMTVAATHGKALWASGATTAALYGLDQAKSNDTAANQIVDFGLGSLKGVATAATFRALGNLDPRSHAEVGAKLTAFESIAANPLTRGVAYGTTGRFFDLGLSRQTYENHSTGNSFDLAHGVGQTLTGTFMSRSMIADGLLFGVSTKLSGSLQGGLESNAMLRTMTTSSVFGLSSGLYSEFSNQQKTGEFDVGRLVTRGVAQAVADGLAGAPAGRYSAALQGPFDGTVGNAGTVRRTEQVESTKPRLIATAPRETGLPKTGALDPTFEPGMAFPKALTRAAEIAAPAGIAERLPQQPALEAPHQVRPAVEKSDSGKPSSSDRTSAESQDLNAGARIIDKPNGDRLIIRTNGDRVLEKPGQPRTTYKPDGRVIVEEENGRVTEYRSRANTPLEERTLNIATSGSEAIGKVLSNFARRPFTLDGREYESVEGFYQGLKWSDPAQRAEIAKLYGSAAKSAGRGSQATSFEYEGQTIEFRSPEHYALMKRAIKASLEQNPEIRDQFLETYPRPLEHKTGRPEKPTTGYPAAEFVKALSEIRAEMFEAKSQGADTSKVASGDETMSGKVSDFLKGIADPEARRLHNIDLYARAFADFERRATGVVTTGSDHVVLRLADGNLLKITPKEAHRPWEDFDMPVVKEGTTQADGRSIRYVVTPEAQPAGHADLLPFLQQLAAQGFRMTDPGVQQLGKYNGETKLLDPFAVVRDH